MSKFMDTTLAPSNLSQFHFYQHQTREDILIPPKTILIAQKASIESKSQSESLSLSN